MIEETTSVRSSTAAARLMVWSVGVFGASIGAQQLLVGFFDVAWMNHQSRAFTTGAVTLLWSALMLLWAWKTNVCALRIATAAAFAAAGAATLSGHTSRPAAWATVVVVAVVWLFDQDAIAERRMALNLCNRHLVSAAMVCLAAAVAPEAETWLWALAGAFLAVGVFRRERVAAACVSVAAILSAAAMWLPHSTMGSWQAGCLFGAGLLSAPVAFAKRRRKRR